jgi:hypothetical protein
VHREKKKVGRNDSCPCGSGKKYKKCHGSLTENKSPLKATESEIQQIAAELQAQQIQREKQQGLGKPIISTIFKDCRFVAVGNTLLWSKQWKTFHDFLFDYIKRVFGYEWGDAELKKNFEDRHPVLQWYDSVCKFQQKNASTGQIHTAQMTGVVTAYLGLAYNLYLLAHNVSVQELLLKRLRNKSQFYGAYYETVVAASFIKAGFTLELEDEADISSKHCEFTANYPDTGAKFSVEAKAREAGKSNANVGNQLYKALLKKANYTRVVFIDVNVPDEASSQDSIPWLKEAMDSLRSKEDSLTIQGTPAPAAYVFVTNYPYHYSLEETFFRWSVFAEGFKIPDFKADTGFPSVREALNAEKKHYEMFKLIDSIKEHDRIPSTFDGEIPEFAFGEMLPKLRIGQKYLIPDGNSQQVIGELVDATVNEPEKAVYGMYKLEDGRSIIAVSPITDEELSAYRRYPDTFFGVYRQTVRKIEDPIELFKFLLETYRNTSRTMLLEFLEDWPHYEMIKEKSQEELASIYCEGLVNSLMHSKHKNQGCQD